MLAWSVLRAAKSAVMRALWGCVYVGPPSLPPEGHQPQWLSGQAGDTLCPPGAAGQRMVSGRAQAGMQEGEERLWGKGTKRNSLIESRGGYGLVFIFNYGQL